ncbi:MAG: FtsX-like permease family protein, partial [Acidobacteriota bacterium]
PWVLLLYIRPLALHNRGQPAAGRRGLLLGVAGARLFRAPPLDAARRVPPIRVLRRDAEPLPPSRRASLLTAAALIGGVTTLAAVQAESVWIGLAFTGGLLLVVGLLASAARGLMRLAARGRSRAALALRHGLANLTRPGAATIGAVVALGVGVLTVVAMADIEGHLDGELRRELPRDAPTAFLVDIQPDQWSDVRARLDASGAIGVDSVPVVMARLRAIDGTPVEQLQEARETGLRGRPAQDGEGAEARWALTREQRLTYLEQLADDNEIVRGALWSDPARAEVSVEEEYAENLGIDLGSVLLFNVQGVPVELHVTSIRSVDWRTFGINFFIVVEPGVLDDAPQHRVAAASIGDDAARDLQNALALHHPNVTVIRVREVLERAASILDRLGLGVRVLGGLTVIAGLVILAGAVGAGALRRGAEVALYKTMGATRPQVIGMFAVEYGLIGLVAGVIGAAGGAVLAWAVVVYGMQIDWALEPTRYALTLVISPALAALAGLAASGQSLRRRPIAVLRGEG